MKGEIRFLVRPFFFGPYFRLNYIGCHRQVKTLLKTRVFPQLPDHCSVHLMPILLWAGPAQSHSANPVQTENNSICSRHSHRPTFPSSRGGHSVMTENSVFVFRSISNSVRKNEDRNILVTFTTRQIRVPNNSGSGSVMTEQCGRRCQRKT
jgi:hypothetical protein